ncbi:hypothetical protein PMIN03_012910 [Paraphaeosphaeria minitans]
MGLGGRVATEWRKRVKKRSRANPLLLTESKEIISAFQAFPEIELNVADVLVVAYARTHYGDSLRLSCVFRSANTRRLRKRHSSDCIIHVDARFFAKPSRWS